MRYIISLLLTFAALLSAHADLEDPAFLALLAPPVSSGVNTAVFDGTDSMRLVSSGPAGLTATGYATLSVWVNFAGGDGATQVIYGWYTSTTFARFRVQRTSSNIIEVVCRNNSNVDVLVFSGTTTITASSGWTHLLVVATKDSDAGNKIYINGTTDTVTVTTRTGAAWTSVASDIRYCVGSNGDATPGTQLNGTLAELWYNDQVNDVISDYYAAGAPVALGANGSTPIGSVPVFYFSNNGSGNAWATDSANGNVFTVTGTLGTGTAP